MSVAKPASKASRPDGETADSEPDDLSFDRRVTEYARVGAPFAVIAGTVIAGSLSGPPAAVLVLAGGALVAVIAIFWASLRLLLGETPLSGADAYALGAPRTEEEQKQAVLRALKDLEFERSVGKISDEDYNELVSKYRAEAKRLLRLLDTDAQPRRDHVATLVATRLHRAGLLSDEAKGTVEASESESLDEVPSEDAAAEARPARRAGERKKAVSPVSSRESDAAREPESARESDAGREGGSAGAGKPTQDVACASCGTQNDEDAVFCKKCGTKRTPTPLQVPAETKDAKVEDPSGGAS